MLMLSVTAARCGAKRDGLYRRQQASQVCRSKEACGGVAPQLADLACAGSETNVLQCPMSIGDDVFCAPEESVLLSCAGHGDPIGKPAAP